MVAGVSLAQRAKEVTSTISIVGIVNDPVANGLVASLARPGGNITGVTSAAGPEIEGKRVEFLKEVLPTIHRMALLGTKWDWENSFGKDTRVAARALGITLLHAEHPPGDYQDAFAWIVRERPDALLVPDTTSNYARRQLIVDFAAKNRLPGVYSSRDFTEAGGFMSYGIDRRDQFRRVAESVGKILKGASRIRERSGKGCSNSDRAEVWALAERSTAS